MKLDNFIRYLYKLSIKKLRQRAYKTVAVCLLASLLAGLLPPPLIGLLAPGVAALLPAPAIALAAGAISGIVFQDFNADGLRNTTASTALPVVDRGVGGVTVTAYDEDGSQCGQTTTSTVTATLGQYTLSHTCTAAKVRVEFTNLPSGYYSGPQGTSNDSSVRFVNATASNVNFGVNHPADYVDANPQLISPRYLEELATPYSTLLSWSYTNRGLVSASGYITPTGEATSNQIGATWGVTYRRATNDIFAAAFVRRQTTMPDVVSADGTTAANSDNVADLGMIYRITKDGDAANNTNYRWLNLAGATDVNGNSIDVGTLATDAVRGITTNSNDVTAFDAVGKQGLGGLEISDDESTIWVMNLYQRKLHAITIQADGTAGSIRSYDIPTAQCNGSGASNDARPFAVKYYRNQVYIGVVCSGENTQTTASMNAYVFSLPDDGVSTTFTQVLSFGLGYVRQPADATCTSISGWQPWRTTWPTVCYSSRVIAPQPILSDIEFDVNGDMIIGLMDRFGNQANANNYGLTGTTIYAPAAAGDTLRAPRQANGTYAIETTATDASATTEYYNGDYFIDTNSGSAQHPENTLGGLAFIPGRGEVVASAYDPVNGMNTQGAYNSGGVTFLSNTNGNKLGSYQTFRDTMLGSVGKAAGMGDVAIVSTPAPIEIGNRVWQDTNRNGVQDPGEDGIAGVTIGLYDNDHLLIDTVTTALDGSYIFSSANGTDAAGRNYGVNLEPNTFYTVAVLDSNFDTGNPLNGFMPTTANSEGDTSNDSINDMRDSDGISVTVGSGVDLATQSGINFTTGGSGVNNHTLDFGFSLPPLSLGNLVWNDVNNNGLKDAGESGIDGVLVNLYQDTDNNGVLNAGDTLVASQSTSNGGHYLFTDLAPATYLVQLDSSNFIPSGGLYSYISSTGTNGSYSGAYEPVTAVGTTDNDDNGTTGPDGLSAFGETGGIVSGPIVLTAGDQPTNESDLDTPTGITDSADNADSNLTIDFGVFQPARLGDFVWHDTNQNGVQDLGEQGINGVTVSLYTPNGADGIAGTADDNLPIATTVTGGSTSGYYSFGYLTPNTPYTIKIDNPTDFAPGGPLAGYTLTDQNAGGDDTADSDAALVNSVPVINVTTDGPGSTNQTLDFGFSTGASLGDYVWFDANHDGIQDATETGIDGVTVHLYDSTGTTLLMTTTTTTQDGTAGYYRFANLTPNTTYVVKLDNPTDFITGGPLANLQLSPTDMGSDDAKDSDATLSGGVPTISAAPTAGSGSHTPTYDFGFYLPAQFGDRVWRESDTDGLANTGTITPIEGLVITATSGTNIYTTTTDANGYYSFTVLPGTYTITYGDIPASYGVLVPSGTPGGNSETGNAGQYTETGNPDQGHTNGTTVTVDSGEANWHVDFAFTHPRADLELRKTADQTTTIAGNLLTYSLTLTNHGPDTATEVVVSDLLPSDATWVSDSSAGSYNPATGQWLVSSLAANASVTLTITVQVH